jgi:hypothetical protein
MRSSIVTRSMVMTLTIGTLAVVALVAACAAPAAESPAPPQVTDAQLRAVSDLERMETMQCSVGILINQYSTNVGVVPDYLYDQVNSIQKAKQDLLDLDGHGCATHMLIAQYEISGQQVPDGEYELAQSIEQSRQQILKRVGLAD